MSSAARGLGWQGGGGCFPWVRRGAGSSLACAGRVARPIANKETQPMTAAADFVITSFDGRGVISSPFETVVVVRRTAIASALHRPAEFGLAGRNAPRAHDLSRAINAAAHTLARVEVVDLNLCVSSRAAAVAALCLRSDLPPEASACERRRDRLRGAPRRVPWWRQPRSALRFPCCELRVQKGGCKLIVRSRSRDR